MSWVQDYSTALDNRDTKEKSQFELFEAYARLAERSTQKGRQTSKSIGSASNDKQPTAGSSAVDDQAALTSIRSDLTEAQRSKVELHANLKLVSDELQVLKQRSQIESKRILDLTGQKNILFTKIKDRDEELKGKSKLLEDVQDELLSLQLQLNITEDRMSKLQQENKDLVDRWMARMGREADAMNDASRFQ